MLHPELGAHYAREQYDDMKRSAARRRLAARCAGRRSPARLAARLLGQMLVHLGAGLLRYGQPEQPAIARSYQHVIGSVE